VPFQRLVRQIARKHGMDIRFRATALEALQQATEAYIVTLFEAMNLMAIHCGRQTVMVKDLARLKELWGMWGVSGVKP